MQFLFTNSPVAVNTMGASGLLANSAWSCNLSRSSLSNQDNISFSRRVIFGIICILWMHEQRFILAHLRENVHCFLTASVQVGHLKGCSRTYHLNGSGHQFKLRRTVKLPTSGEILLKGRIHPLNKYFRWSISLYTFARKNRLNGQLCDAPVKPSLGLHLPTKLGSSGWINHRIW